MHKKWFKIIFFVIGFILITGVFDASAFWIFNEDEIKMPAEKLINFYYDGYLFKIKTEKNTVGELLDEQGISLTESDFIFPPREEKLNSGMSVNFKKAIEIKILADNEEISKKTIYRKVSEVLTDAGISLSHLDKTKPEKDNFIEEGGKISVTRIEIEEIEKEEKIAFETIEKEDDDLKWRKKEVKQAGENGIKKIKYRITYKNGKEASREKLSSEVIKEPVDEIIKIGTKVEIGKTKTGLASWYAYTGTMACASRMFPKGTWLRITNKANGKQIFVVVNDYGPMRGTGKMIDLDKVAFEKLGNLSQGVIEVKVEEILN